MSRLRTLPPALVCAAAIILIQRAPAASTPIILQGTVTMIDGTAPPKAAGLHRVCSGPSFMSGPITDKKGNFLWRMDLDPMYGSACYIEAQLEGFISTHFDMKSISLSEYVGSHILTLPNLVLSPRDSGELGNLLLMPDSEIPDRAAGAWKAAVKNIVGKKITDAIADLQKAVQRVPKFAAAWIVLGILYESQGQDGVDQARDAYRHAVDANPKLLAPYLRLACVYDEQGNWFAAATAAETLIKADNRFYPEIYLYLAIARMGLKDLTGAESSANTAIKLDVTHRFPRAEYELGRILQAKGDLSGAREHIAKYLQLDPGVHDASQIQALLDSLGR
jgi:tetratricopeptide (TPR) repeat protein